MVIEAGVVAGYMIAWAVRKARRAAERLDQEADTVIDAGLDRLHDAITDKLGADPVLAEVEDEVATDGQVSELTRQRIELSLTAAARKDDNFGRTVTALIAELRDAERAGGPQVLAGGQARVFTGDAHAKARGGGVAFGQVGGDVRIGQPETAEQPDPVEPDR